MFSMKQIVIWIPLRWGWGLCLGHPWWIWCCGTLSQVLSTGTLRFLLKNKLSCQAVTLSIYCFRWASDIVMLCNAASAASNAKPQSYSHVITSRNGSIFNPWIQFHPNRLPGNLAGILPEVLAGTAPGQEDVGQNPRVPPYLVTRCRLVKPSLPLQKPASDAYLFCSCLDKKMCSILFHEANVSQHPSSKRISSASVHWLFSGYCWSTKLSRCSMSYLALGVSMTVQSLGIAKATMFVPFMLCMMSIDFPHVYEQKKKAEVWASSSTKNNAQKLPTPIDPNWNLPIAACLPDCSLQLWVEGPNFNPCTWTPGKLLSQSSQKPRK